MLAEKSYEVILDRPFQQTLEEVEKVLKSRGFSLTTRVDIQRVMEDRLKVAYHPYILLGACDPEITARALEIDPAIALMLPCNIAVETTAGGSTLVRAADPLDSLGCRAADNPALAALAVEAGQRIAAVIAALRSAAPPTPPEAKHWDRLTNENRDY